VSPPVSTDDKRPEAVAKVDPRFEARRAAVARDERRRRLGRLGTVVLLLALAMATFGLTRSSLTDVDTVTVTGRNRSDREQILAASGITLGTQLTDIDTAYAARRIESLVPWVAAARVSRNWPASVRITVVERQPVAQVQAEDGSWLLVDAAGHLLEATPLPEAGLKTVEGTAPGARPGAVLDEASARGVGVLAQMSPGLLSRVSGLRYRETDVELMLVPGATVAFGAPDQVQMKLLALETVLARVDQSCVSAIDIRVPRRPLVRRDPVCDAGSGR